MTDADIRNGAILAVQRLWRRFGDGVPWAAIAAGFTVEGDRIALLSPQGVFKPAQMSRGILSVRTVIGSQYDDTRVSDDRVWYDYSPRDYLNAELRENLRDRLPLLYFLQVKEKPGVEYLIFAPVDVVDDDPARRRFLLDLSPSALYEESAELDPALVRALMDDEPVPADLHRAMERKYGASTTRTRHFQAHFRRAVLAAYRHRCGICAIGEKPVLDGAHLVADREELGEPRVSNGLSLCALHHRAFDRDLVGITPDFAIHVFRDRLEHPDEDEGAILTQFDGARLRLPRDEDLQPDRELVDWRWQAALEG